MGYWGAILKIKLLLILAAVVAFTAVATLQFQQADARPSNENTPGRESILPDPRIPAGGNSKGDLIIVEYFDYQCLSCKQVNSVLQRIVREDGHVRLVLKEWPIFGGISIYAARLGLAAKFQNKLSEARRGFDLYAGETERRECPRTLAKAGIDIPRAQRDLATNQIEIDAILARNKEQATALGFEGTPAFTIGNFRVPAVFNTANLKQYIADARTAAKHELWADDDGR